MNNNVTTICFDLRCLQIGHESRGIGMHAKALLEHLPLRDDVRYVMYAFDKNDPIKDLGITMSAPYTLVTTATVKMAIDSPKDALTIRKIIWHSFSPLRNQGIDVFLQFDFTLGLPKFKKTKTILVAYDLIPLIFRDEYLPTPRAVMSGVKGTTKKLKKALRSLYYSARFSLHYKNFRRADLIMSISKNTTESLVEILKISRKKIVDNPLAAVFSCNTEECPPSLSGLTDPFVLYIGATDSRKRVQDLVIALDAIYQEKLVPVSLVLAGKEFTDKDSIPNNEVLEAIKNSPQTNNIYAIGYVSDSEKLWLYRHALAFVFPTLYEGFGLPILEAMHEGCIAISYDNSSIPEVAGDGALLVKTGDTQGLTRAIIDVLEHTDALAKLREKALVQSSRFTWEHHITVLLDITERLVKRG